MQFLARLLLSTLLAAIICSVKAQPGPSPQMAFLTEKEAVMVLPPDVICGSDVRRALWSSSGRYALLQREEMRIPPEMFKSIAAGKPPQGPPPGMVSLVLWDGKEHKVTEVWKRPTQPGASVHDFRWLTGTDAAIAIVEENLPPVPPDPPRKRHSLLRINGALGTAKSVSFVDSPQNDYPFFQLSPSLVLPVAIVQAYTTVPGESTKTTLQVIREEGPLSRPILGPQDPAAFIFGGWCNDGTVVSVTTVDRKEKSISTRKRFVLDPRTGRLEETSQAPKPALFAEISSDIRLRSTTAAIKEGETSRNVTPLWLETVAKSDRPRALIAAHSSWSQLSPKSDAVLYFQNGIAYAAQVIRFPKELFLAMEQQAQRAVAISNAKQIGLAAMMYAQDYDEKLPTGDDINGKLEPYLKNADLFNGFTYTHGGGPLKDVASPAETELGYVTGPGGRAVIYVDGHVKWRND